MKADGAVELEHSRCKQKPPSCCICLDVRIGAILIGLLYMMVYSACLIVNMPRLLHKHDDVDVNGGWQYYELRYIAEKHNVDHNMVFMVLVSLIFILVVMMIYGAALRRSNFILPFFCWQVFDMCRLVFTSATFISYADRVKYHYENFEEGYSGLKYVSLPRFRMLIISASLIALVVVYFMMNVIWDCFKHAKATEESRNRDRAELPPTYMVFQGDMETMNLLPSYDDVIKTPPPAYSQS